MSPLRTAAAAAVALALAGCHDHDHIPSSADRVPAPMLLEVTGARVTGSPIQASARITGQMPNVCTAVDRIDQRRDGRTVTVTITTRATAQACILLYPPPLEIVLPLPGPFEAGEYVLRVNRFETTFRL